MATITVPRAFLGLSPLNVHPLSLAHNTLFWAWVPLYLLLILYLEYSSAFSAQLSFDFPEPVYQSLRYVSGALLTNNASFTSVY